MCFFFFQSNSHPSELKILRAPFHKHSYAKRKLNKIQKHFMMKVVHIILKAQVSNVYINILFSELQICLARHTVHYILLIKRCLLKKAGQVRCTSSFIPEAEERWEQPIPHRVLGQHCLSGLTCLSSPNKLTTFKSQKGLFLHGTLAMMAEAQLRSSMMSCARHKEKVSCSLTYNSKK